ncbi:MAG: homoserine dehydrogenase [Rhodospirillaceae bacterium TMED8]|nr:homoserine dehydrogenase [Magnetovibrio sp.]OUT51991.1 MAG: homoserine dehydrogenase [Rhodospirillaceae bacterium TMED8]|tara:strand:- start:531 stop:1835 length:1305 start_codon:yes stop_codon:yes gene_type:complete
MGKQIRVGIAGLGNVGIGVVRVLSHNSDLLLSRAGRALTITAISAREKNRDRGVDLTKFDWHGNACDLARAENVDIVVELIGGDNGVAKDVVETAISNGKHVVTANKALIGHHGTNLAKAAELNKVVLAFEAAVAGGIPIVKALRDGLAANRVERLTGILNGTCNFILSNMAETGRPFAEILAEAKALGYAESDPTFDIDGIDTAHKLSILAALAFGTEVDFANVHVEGIRHISPIDIEFARELGYGIKLLGVAARVPDELGGGIEQRVHPCMVRKNAPINHVSGVFNGIEVIGDFVDTTIYEGRGAGQGPTASAVVADLVDIARGLRIPAFSLKATDLRPPNTIPMGRRVGAYYVRFMVVDRPGVFADIAAVLRDHDVSMESVLQRGRSRGERVSVVMTVHETREEAMQKGLQAIAALDSVVEPPSLIRIEDL